MPIPQWEVLICGHHPGYISWEDYLANQERLHASCAAPSGQGGGAVRERRGLLQGIVRCGRCGRFGAATNAVNGLAAEGSLGDE